MSIPRPPTPPSRTPQAATAVLNLSPRKGAAPVPRIVYYAVEGFGKTTFGCQAPAPVVLAARDERGVQRLLDAGTIPDTPVIDITDWKHLFVVLDALATQEHDRRTIVIDSLGAFERLCHEHVTVESFKGDPGDGGFLGFGRGPKVCLTEWAKMLSRLDALNRKGMMIVLLGHSFVEKFKNPSGNDFDRYSCRIDGLAWSAIKAWADCVFFGNYLTVTQQSSKLSKAKGIGGTDRIVYTQRRDTHDAKPGYALPPEIVLSEDPSQTWNEITKFIFNKGDSQ